MFSRIYGNVSSWPVMFCQSEFLNFPGFGLPFFRQEGVPGFVKVMCVLGCFRFASRFLVR